MTPLEIMAYLKYNYDIITSCRQYLQTFPAGIYSNVNHMNQKPLFLAVALTALLVIGGVFWMMKKRPVATNQPVTTEPVVQTPVQTESEALNFVTDVDPDVRHWQTKETESFAIKFPKEWYWLESDLEKAGYHSKVITNNPNFEIDKYAEIGIFSDIGPAPPITIVNNSELVITDRGSPTSNAGTPLDALDSIFELAKRNYPAVSCAPPGNPKILPIVARCSAHYPEDQTQLSYYVIDKDLSLTLTLRKKGDSDVLQSIVEKMARSIQIKH